VKVNSTIRGGALAVISLMALATVAFANGRVGTGSPDESAAVEVATFGASFSAEALAQLAAYDWKRNNVRELRNVVERMIIASDGEALGPEQIPEELISAHGELTSLGATPRSFVELKAEAERQIVVAALERNEWHITRTAQELGLADHASLLKIMKRHGLKKD